MNRLLYYGGKLRYSPTLSMLGVTGAVLLAVFLIDHSEQARYQQEIRSEVLRQVSTARAQLEGALNRRLFITRGLATYVAAQPNISDNEFELIAKLLIAQRTGIRSLQLARNSVVSHVYPLKGNEAALGDDLLRDPIRRAAVQRTITTRTQVIGGPFQSRDRGSVLIGHVPIFVLPAETATGSGEYWGLALMVLDLETILSEAGLLDNSEGFKFSLRAGSGSGTRRSVFFGESRVFDLDPVLSEVYFPNGSWQLAAIPSEGWPRNAPRSWKWRLSGVLLSLLAGLLVWNRAREPERLRRAVNEATASLRESQERYRILTSISPVGMSHASAEGLVEYVNERWCRISGLTTQEASGEGWLRGLHPEDRERIAQLWRHATNENASFTAEFRFLHPDGRTVWVLGQTVPEKDVDGRLSGFVGTITDVTDRKFAEDEARHHESELAHVARINTMGEMATSLAHELNQPLSAIINYATGCIIRLQEGSGTKPEELTVALQQITTLAARAGEIIRRVRSFVSKREPRRELVDLNDLVREVARFVEAESKRLKISLKLELAHWIPPIEGDTVQIEQVILNLVRNGFEAMSDTGSSQRELTIRTAPADANAVQVSISDLGKGLSAEAVDHLFDPFFTTKPTGMGMGLSISRSIIEAHGGRLEALVNASVGMTFHFILPAANGKALHG